MSFTTLMELLNTQNVDHVMPLCLSLIMHALAGGVDPDNFRNIFNAAK